MEGNPFWVLGNILALVKFQLRVSAINEVYKGDTRGNFNHFVCPRCNKGGPEEIFFLKGVLPPSNFKGLHSHACV